MKRRHAILWLIATSGLLGCQSHLFFVESAHVGLKAKLSTEGAGPGEVSIGYRRGLVAIIPQRRDKGSSGIIPRVAATTPSPEGTQVIIRDDRDDLMSLYTVFRANVGFNDPTDICHFLVTGRAAAFLLSDASAVEGAVHNLCAPASEKESE